MQLDVQRCCAALSETLRQLISVQCSDVEQQTYPTRTLLTPLDYVGAGRLEEAVEVVHAYRVSGIEPFMPVFDQGVHLGVLAEWTSAGLMLLDGTHRAKAAWQLEIPAIKVFTYSMSFADPPCNLVSMADLAVRRNVSPIDTKRSNLGDAGRVWRDGPALVSGAKSLLERTKE
ncbi:hypothetical protein GCM10027039_08320 [Terrabacter koreensis]